MNKTVGSLMGLNKGCRTGEDSGSDWDSFSGSEENHSNSKAKKTNHLSQEIINGKPEYINVKSTEDSQVGYNAKHKESQHVKLKQSFSQENVPFTVFKADNTSMKKDKKTPHTKIKKSYVATECVDSDLNHYDDITENILVNNNAILEKKLQKDEQINECVKKEENNDGKNFELQNKELIKEKTSITIQKTYYYEKSNYDYHAVLVPNDAFMPKIADKMELHSRRIWQEFFGFVRILIDFILLFVLELTAFLFRSIIQRVIVGIIYIIGDWLIKPVFSASFNALIQPIFVLVWNLTSELRQATLPFSNLLLDMIKPFAKLLKSFRLFEYRVINCENNLVKEL
ncbi:uncharacterized protein LOC124812295 isoform X1 [Hydra vulgaris]|uniref:uncharacterized protein LOC124812295 isoform X1 n=1 Tax=Hydra vulgaris TaxID=6087 RepID=UPI0032E9F6BE